MPSAWRTVTNRDPATGPAKVTTPAPAARTGLPGSVRYSMPRLPAAYGPAGRRNGSITGASVGGA